MKKFEYKHVSAGFNEDKLNELGADGWQMCGYEHNLLAFVFVRELLE